MERELPLKYLPERYYRYEVSGWGEMAVNESDIQIIT